MDLNRTDLQKIHCFLGTRKNTKVTKDGFVGISFIEGKKKKRVEQLPIWDFLLNRKSYYKWVKVGTTGPVASRLSNPAQLSTGMCYAHTMINISSLDSVLTKNPEGSIRIRTVHQDYRFSMESVLTKTMKVPFL